MRWKRSSVNLKRKLGKIMTAFMAYVYGPVICLILLSIMKDEIKSIRNKFIDGESIMSEATSLIFSVFIGVVLITIFLG
jgi:hypothetical protein